MSTNFRHLLLISFDSPEGTDVVSINETFGWVVALDGSVAESHAQAQL